MTERPTCGTGLAAHAPLPEQLGRLSAATAAVLEAHLGMLDVTDPHSAAEHATYVALAEDHRRAARLLGDLARRMVACREMPMGRHVHSPGANAAMLQSFAELVTVEEALSGLLGARLPDDRRMLSAMRGEAGTAP